MDKRLAAALAGHTALISELARVMVEKNVIEISELKGLVLNLIRNAKKQNVNSGFVSGPNHFMEIIKSWENNMKSNDTRQ